MQSISDAVPAALAALLERQPLSPAKVDFAWRVAVGPAVARATHASVDPDGDGLMTCYYEMWDSDANNPGGHSALQTAMSWAALRAGRDIAARLNDRDYAMRHGGAAVNSHT